ncbi:hypothetical protein CEE45_03485 [Candidatus Heimdallarchaeota archaeon B3_Heim]|nr:MAG: hypothetical protein CEE45_03485 [Candidatus Heimdallarchaeota archaeon B3_Heim]
MQKEKYTEFFEGELFEANLLHQKVIHEDKPIQKWMYITLGIYILAAMHLSSILSIYSIWYAEFGLGVRFFILFDTFLDENINYLWNL